jgi:hypothetical protein
MYQESSNMTFRVTGATAVVLLVLAAGCSDNDSDDRTPPQDQVEALIWDQIAWDEADWQ